MSKLKDLTGMRVGRLTVLERDMNKDPMIKNTSAYWICQCDCGRIISVNSSNLIRSHNLGCRHCKRKPIPGLRDSREANPLMSSKLHNVWNGIKSRCTNPNAQAYSNYGGRGIKICDEWRTDFLSFYNYVSQLEHFGESGRSIDRINNDGNYEPGNIRWATKSEQARNKRKPKSKYASDEERKEAEKRLNRESYARRKAKKAANH